MYIVLVHFSLSRTYCLSYTVQTNVCFTWVMFSPPGWQYDLHESRITAAAHGEIGETAEK